VLEDWGSGGTRIEKFDENRASYLMRSDASGVPYEGKNPDIKLHYNLNGEKKRTKLSCTLTSTHPSLLFSTSLFKTQSSFWMSGPSLESTSSDFDSSRHTP
jgi:hypothetical protein